MAALGEGNLLAMIGSKYKRYSGFTTTVADSFSDPGGDLRSGVTFDGTNFEDHEDTPKNRKYSGFSSTIKDSFTQDASTSCGATEDSNGDFYTFSEF